MKLVWTQEALNNLCEIEEFIANDSPTRAIDFTNYLINKAESLSENPRIGRVVPEISNSNIRELIVRKYRIVYRIRPGLIEILTVFEGHKLFDPDNLELDSE